MNLRVYTKTKMLTQTSHIRYIPFNTIATTQTVSRGQNSPTHENGLIQAQHTHATTHTFPPQHTYSAATHSLLPQHTHSAITHSFSHNTPIHGYPRFLSRVVAKTNENVPRSPFSFFTILQPLEKKITLAKTIASYEKYNGI